MSVDKGAGEVEETSVLFVMDSVLRKGEVLGSNEHTVVIISEGKTYSLLKDHVVKSVTLEALRVLTK